MQPRKHDLEELRQQLEAMDSELAGYRKHSSRLQLDVKQLNLKIHGNREEAKSSLGK